MFKVSMWQAEDKIKENPYIAEAKITRNLSRSN
jgi:cell division septal protein FtsQ